MRADVIAALLQERVRQDARFGQQNHLDGTGGEGAELNALIAKVAYEAARAEGCLTWSDILLEEVGEALAETDQARLRAELIQVAAVAVAWVECIDRRGNQPSLPSKDSS